MLKALKSWNYKGSYNTWTISNYRTAIRIPTEHSTIEYRIGEMSFDYELIIKRIIHCQNITRRLKSILMSSEERNKILLAKYKVK